MTKKAKIASRHDDRQMLKSLSIGDNVCMQHPATVTRDIGHRTCEVTTPTGKTIKRNRQFLRISRPKVVSADNIVETPFHDTCAKTRNSNHTYTESSQAAYNAAETQ